MGLAVTQVEGVMQMIYVVSLVVSALLASAAVLTHRFNDNILQRVGLCVVAFASCAEIYLLLHSAECCQFHNTRSLFIIGFSLYALGTASKVIRHGPRI